MTIALATAWYPRGELDRFLTLLPVLQDAYTGIAISLPPEAEEALIQRIESLDLVAVVITGDWSWGRYLALERALQFPGTPVQSLLPPSDAALSFAPRSADRRSPRESVRVGNHSEYPGFRISPASVFQPGCPELYR